jgi:hypothetical protein
VCWLLPFTALAVFHGERTMAWLAGAVIGISTLQLYVIREIIWGEDAALALVLTRNILLVTLVVVGCVKLARHRASPSIAPRPRAAREPEPVA